MSGTLTSDYRDSCQLLHVSWFGIWDKLLHSRMSDGEHPYTILNESERHNGTRVCSSGGCYAKACPKQFNIAAVSIV